MIKLALVSALLSMNAFAGDAMTPDTSIETRSTITVKFKLLTMKGDKRIYVGVGKRISITSLSAPGSVVGKETVLNRERNSVENMGKFVVNENGLVDILGLIDHADVYENLQATREGNVITLPQWQIQAGLALQLGNLANPVTAIGDTKCTIVNEFTIKCTSVIKRRSS